MAVSHLYLDKQRVFVQKVDALFKQKKHEEDTFKFENNKWKFENIKMKRLSHINIKQIKIKRVNNEST